MKNIVVGKLVIFLTKNGRGKYAIFDFEDYEKIRATVKLLSKLKKVEKVIKGSDEWLTED